MRRWTHLLVAAFLGALLAMPLAVYAGHRFEDVPGSHTFHSDIDWMAVNGITFGCNPPANNRYCPDDPVTRGQMAAFLKRLALNQVVDAGTIDGYSASSLGPRAAFANNNNFPNNDTRLTVEIDAPAPGVVVVNANLDILGGLGTQVSCSVRTDDTLIGGPMFTTLSSDINEGACGVTGAGLVEEGTHEIEFVVDVVIGSPELANGNVNALWIPFDGAGSVPTP